ncbi:MAG: hypothetical protein F9K22_07230 [Bacteroidetes bacterium]|nr:MAG: hypothetical protein F9K22_07230 [Bacteroidota bacterium]
MMPRSAKFFILTTVVNVVLSAMTVFNSNLRDVRLADVATFYATAFGAGASVAALALSLLNRRRKENGPAE